MIKPKILIVEDDPDGCRSVSEAIEDIGYNVTTATNANTALKLFSEYTFDVILTDLVLPDIDGIELLSRIRKTDKQLPVLIMTAYGSVSSAVDALKSGAYDYITKPLDLNDIQSKVARAVEAHQLRGEVAQLTQAVYNQYSSRTIIAESREMQEIISQIESLAGTDATVMIQGESGTGKELVAHALHVEGKRRKSPFVAINCGALSENLLDSELFGHEKGAFTGALSQHKGAFERAHGGTLFLDEIGDAPLSVQVKLLRVLEEREILRVGGQSTVNIDVRLISASNKNLNNLIKSGDFREDLLYRLNVITINIPPLRQRRKDIRPLADRFIASACHNNGRHISSVNPEYYISLENFDWPGNVRQLRNIVESSVIMAKGASLQKSDIPLNKEALSSSNEIIVPDNMTMSEIEKEILLQTLNRYKGNRTLASEKLEISRRTIQRKIKEYNLPF